MIDLEGELVRSSFDPKTRMCSYTFGRGGRQWTVRLHMDHFTPMNKIERRQHLASLVENAMRGPDDEGAA